MKSSAIVVASLIPLVSLGGCDLTALDNYNPPTSLLSGRVVFQGEPVGVRNRGVQLELWEPGWELNQKIQVNVNHDGTYEALLFDGSYELNLLPGNGPWVNNPTRVPIEVRRAAVLDVEVVPYYVIRNAQIVNNNGRIDATFDIGSIDTSRAVEYVGLYVGETLFVDRINQAVRLERPRSQIPSLNDRISLSVTLPNSIYITPSPLPRDEVFVRIGVKTVGVAEMLFTQVLKVAI